MRRPELARLVAAALLATVPAVAHQKDEGQGEVQLRGELVEVRAVVTDKSGRPRDDLAKEDFEVRENGKPRDIAFFSVERVGAAPAAPETPGAPTPSPAPGATAAAAPASTARTVVLFVDAANMRPSSVTRTKTALRAFVDAKLGERDLAAVVASGNSLGLESQFTTDRAVLRAAIEKISPRPASFLGGAFTPYLASEIVRETNPEALAAGVYLVREEEGVPPEMDADAPGGNPSGSARLNLLARRRAVEVLNEAAQQRRLTLAALRAAVDRLARTPGQRLLALVSDGFTLFDRGGDRDTAELKAVIARAVRSGVVIYSLSGEGLESGAFTGPDDPLYAVPPTIYPGYGASSRRDLEDGMTALAKDTGGDVFRNTNDFAGALGRVLDDNRVYYVLAYYPEGDAAAARSIEVKLRNRPGLSVRAQRGYDAPAAADALASSASPVVEALAAAAPPTGLPVTAGVAFAGTSSEGPVATVDVHVDGGGLEFREEAGRRAFALEVATAVYDANGASVDTKVEALDGRLQPQAYELARANGFRVTRRVVLKPGRYQVRAAVREPSSGRIGAASAWLDVPDLGDGKLALGGLTLTGSRGADGQLFVPRTPHGVRTYVAGDALVYAVTAFNAGAPERAEMRIAILAGERVLFRSAWEPAASRAVERKEGAVRLSGQLQLGGTPPGAYTLRLEVRDAARGQAAARAADFVVEKD